MTKTQRKKPRTAPALVRYVVMWVKGPWDRRFLARADGDPWFAVRCVATKREALRFSIKDARKFAQRWTHQDMGTGRAVRYGQ